ncbi:MAG: hypothetical protein C4617_04205 [Candidatus Liberibacter europaeus]|uniref:Uncharacterized protein n=1 Tax=Candidatus Liberibacter europaeus TaxID=744859 RepID=A0A2T4VXA2_9HYPH|nr:hypothetical protein [Candidatus Liberibacter europaeus]PTL86406.1 MAG: hypothetical protein C4617_04205 [Candidatus Liberibacter europaeus]
MIQYFWIAVDIFVITATLVTCFLMNEQFSWWIRVLLPCFLISMMVWHIAHVSGLKGLFFFSTLPIVFLGYFSPIS